MQQWQSWSRRFQFQGLFGRARSEGGSENDKIVGSINHRVAEDRADRTQVLPPWGAFDGAGAEHNKNNGSAKQSFLHLIT